MHRSCCAKAFIARSIPTPHSTRTTGITPTGLVGYVRERNFGRVFLAGLALDFCVRYSAQDAYRHGFDVVVVEDACRGIDVDGSMHAARASFAALGIARIRAAAIA